MIIKMDSSLIRLGTSEKMDLAIEMNNSKNRKNIDTDQVSNDTEILDATDLSLLRD